MKRLVALVTFLVLVLLLAACANATDSVDQESGAAADTSPTQSAEGTTTEWPEPLTQGSPIEQPHSSPNFRTPAESTQLSVLGSWRWADAKQAQAVLPFDLRLPADTGGMELQYLTTSYRDPAASDTVFAAVYSRGLMVLVQWPSASRGAPGSETLTREVRGLPASIEQQDNDVPSTVITWVEDGVVYRLWYAGDEQQAMRTAESIPN